MSTTDLKYDAAVTMPLLEEVSKRSGQNLTACYQCRRCAAGCPVGEATGVTPDRLIRMILLNDKDAALNNRLVWQCVACYTCGTRCPNNIHTARITETLKHMIKEAHAEALIPKIADFHSSFLTSTSHFGRVNEMEFMGIYEMKTAKYELTRGGGLKAIFNEIKNLVQLSLTMMKIKRMHVGLEKVKGLAEVKRMYAKAKK
jgi:heterodisulfide reductase subunit C